MSDPLFSSSRSKILMAPGDHQDFNAAYVPVDCDFTDELEYVAIKKILVEIQFKKSSLQKDIVVGTIVDIYTFQKEEFIKLSDDTVIRLDHLIQIKILEQNCDNGVCEIKRR